MTLQWIIFTLFEVIIQIQTEIASNWRDVIWYKAVSVSAFEVFSYV